jgi:probable rRNA maturation factor
MKTQIDIQNRTKSLVEKKFLKNIIEGSIETLRINEKFELNLLLVDDQFIKGLNKKYRGVNCPTDILTFGILDKKRKIEYSPDRILHLGDIVISLEQAERQSREQKHSLKTELAFLIIHGILHIFGFTHDNIKNKKEMDFAFQKIFNKLIMKKIVILNNKEINGKVN